MLNSLLLAIFISTTAFAYEVQIKKGEMSPEFEALLEHAHRDTGTEFSKENFLLIEDRDLATSHFTMWVQTNSEIPLAQTAIRRWTDLKTGELILAEMHLNQFAVVNEFAFKAKLQKGKFSKGALKSKQLAQHVSKMVSNVIANHETDNQILGIKSQDLWLNNDLVRQTIVRGRRGVHTITISLLKNKLIESHYREFPQADHYHSMKAHVYPIYEEVEGTGERLHPELRELKYVHSTVVDGGDLPLGTMTNTFFGEEKYSALLALTPMGQELGLWSEASLRRDLEVILAKHPKAPNSFENGMLLQGKYATINLHPAVIDAFKDINFTLKPSVNHIIAWGQTEQGVIARPVPGFFGKKITSEDDVLSRIPVRLADHNPAAYINSGVDEVQVYYSVTVLMEALAEMGFTDPVLSTEPFHAFLFDPDISMRDNAYYWDNTINFTTYSPNQANYARDNTTIWHELGHGVMDRLMGPYLGFADSKGGYGGLSEGMADFLADLVVEHQTNGQTFAGKDLMRIMNQTGFYLTNEFHDEGEAYGGVMKDMLAMVFETYGREGLHPFTDLTLEAMRLTRNHPALSARGWFEHMILADELGSDVRTPGQFKALMEKALSNRNFAFSKEFKPADMEVTFNDTLLTNESAASRERPITPCEADGSVNYELKVKLTSGDSEFIKFPAIVKVEYLKGALQGAIRWSGEASNPTEYVVNSSEEVLSIPLEASMSCDFINGPEDTCKDYAYLQVWQPGESKPRAKKRFYLRIKNNDTCEAK